MFRRLGAEVFHAPTMQTVKDPPEELRPITEALIRQPPDYLIANTGFGMRLWLGHASGWGMEDSLKDALRQVRIAARGPKSAGALSSAGVPMWWRAPTEQLGEVADHLIEEGVGGKRVAFQMQGRDAPEITARLEEAGAVVTTIPVYRWVKPPATHRVVELVDRCCRQEIDAITFTAGPQVHYLMELAESTGREQALVQALNDGTVVGCIGPVCASAAREEGIRDPLVPGVWRLGSLVKAVAEALSPASG
jgi:uroporphyrinogen-III synthase